MISEKDLTAQHDKEKLEQANLKDYNKTEEVKTEENKSDIIRMPSVGQRFKLRDTKFEVKKSSGFKFTAEAIDEKN